MTPVRMQRRRTRGYDMQAESRAINGLPCIYVGRPTMWGNPYSIAKYGRELAVRNYRRRMVGLLAIGALDLSALAGHNLACWCPLDAPCHADVLLEMARDVY